ncbi:MAG: hypothetical protein VX642_05145 [Bdellovibrionota bacterium]|nr:hypothetical protein [Bdellovibrionota bacterium]
MKFIVVLLCVFSIIVFSTTSRNQEKPTVVPKLYPLENQSKFSLGFSNFVADLYWLRVIQNLDYCESSGEKSVNSGLGVDKILAETLGPSRCNKGWVFQMLDLITDLAPKFRRVYRVGAEMLSVAVDDREGARIIFEKGLKRFPEYWELAYSASYHYLFEYQNPQRAGELLEQAAYSGGPFWFLQMAGTMYSRAGKLLLAEVTLRSYVDKYKGQRGEEAAKKRLEEVLVMKKKMLDEKESE